MYKLLNDIDFKEFHNKLSELYDKKMPLLLKKDVLSEPYKICKGTLLKIIDYNFSEDYSQLNLTVCILLDEVWFNISIKTEEFNEYFEVDTVLQDMYIAEEKQLKRGEKRFMLGSLSSLVICIIVFFIFARFELLFLTLLTGLVSICLLIYFCVWSDWEESDSFLEKKFFKEYHEIHESIQKYIEDKETKSD